MLGKKLTTSFSSFSPSRIDIEECKHRLACRYIAKGTTSSTMNHVVISDFDETVTNRDTTCILGQLPYYIDSQLTPKWPHFVEVYWEHYTKFQEKATGRVLPLLREGEATIIADSSFQKFFHSEVEFQTLKRILELSSTTELAACNIFKGIKHSQVHELVHRQFQGSNSLLRPGFKEFVALLPTDRFHVVSVNWSREFIRDVIGNDNVLLEHISCNNLISQDDEYTGQFSNELLTGSDKIKVIADILARYDKRGENCAWYIGDSDTDLLGVLYPNINGVLLIDPIAEPEKFRKITHEILGLPSEKMEHFAHNSSEGWYKCCEKQGDKWVYLVKSWKDLKKLVFSV